MSHCPRCGNLEYAVEREIDRRLKSIEESQERILHELHELRHPNRSFPTSIVFKEITMNPTIGGNTQVFTGVLAPSGATYPADTVFAVTSNDPAVVPTVATSLRCRDPVWFALIGPVVHWALSGGPLRNSESARLSPISFAILGFLSLITS